MSINLGKVPLETQAATKHVLGVLLHEICPLLQKLRSKLQFFNDYECEDEIVKIKNVSMLCSSQIQKCMVNFIDVMKMENKQELHLRESRQFIFERLSWCVTKLSTVENSLEQCKLKEDIRQDLSEDPMFASPMYFVNWIDYTFEILAKLAEDVYRTDYKSNNSVYEDWKQSMVEHVTSLHMCIDELLLSAMTLCKYCLPEDQTVLRARCQVVLRETTALFGELINDDISVAVKVTRDNLKLPIMPSNVNMMIDVLKDVLYVLETNTNTALLALLIHCYVNSISPVDSLKDHYNNKNVELCPCHVTDIEDCAVVKDFDLYNERLQQIGSFAVSCSSDQKRILNLRSSLSSLESLDPQLVPSVTTSPNGCHSELLANFWKQEVLEIRDTVFLIVDPIAFVEKCKGYMHDLMLEMRQKVCYDKRDLCIIMSIGRIVYDFFDVYRRHEPDAIAHYKELDQLLQNVNRAHKECMTVSQFFKHSRTFISDLKTEHNNREITFESLITRIKLLYSMVKRVHELIRPKDSDEEWFGEEEIPVNRNLTHTIHNEINTDTYTNVQRKTEPNFTRSVFARTGGVKTPSNNVFLSKLTKHLQLKKGVQEELSFSAQVSELFNGDKDDRKSHIHNVKTAGKLSLRKAVLSNQREFPFMRKLDNTINVNHCGDETGQRNGQGSALDVSASLQISEILNEINNITTSFLPSGDRKRSNITRSSEKSVGDINATNHGTLGDTATSSIILDATQPSNVTTLERINDLDLVETKLNSLRANFEFETHL